MVAILSTQLEWPFADPRPPLDEITRLSTIHRRGRLHWLRSILPRALDRAMLAPSADTPQPHMERAIPIAVPCRVWGPRWSQRKLLVHCDNTAVVAIMSSGTCRDQHAMALVRDIFSAAQHQFTIFVRHIIGVDNSIADALSRLQMEKFRELAQHADKEATQYNHLEGWWRVSPPKSTDSLQPACRTTHSASTRRARPPTGASAITGT